MPLAVLPLASAALPLANASSGLLSSLPFASRALSWSLCLSGSLLLSRSLSSLPPLSLSGSRLSLSLSLSLDLCLLLSGSLLSGSLLSGSLLSGSLRSLALSASLRSLLFSRLLDLRLLASRSLSSPLLLAPAGLRSLSLFLTSLSLSLSGVLSTDRAIQHSYCTQNDRLGSCQPTCFLSTPMCTSNSLACTTTDYCRRAVAVNNVLSRLLSHASPYAYSLKRH